MKTKNQTEQKLLELAASAANEEKFSKDSPSETSLTGSHLAWSPYEVWRTRVKTPALTSRKGTGQI